MDRNAAMASSRKAFFSSSLFAWLDAPMAARAHKKPDINAVRMPGCQRAKDAQSLLELVVCKQGPCMDDLGVGRKMGLAV